MAKVTLPVDELNAAWEEFLRNTASNRSVWEAFKYAWNAARPAPETLVSPSPLAQAVLDQIDGTNLGVFITSAVDHIEKGGNCATGKLTLGSGLKIDVRLSRASEKAGEPHE